MYNSSKYHTAYVLHYHFVSSGSKVQGSLAHVEDFSCFPSIGGVKAVTAACPHGRGPFLPNFDRTASVL